MTINKFYLSQFAEQLGDARQPLCRALEVSVLQYQLNKLRVPSAHSLLQDWTHTQFTLSLGASSSYMWNYRTKTDNSLVQPWVLQCVGSEECLSRTLVDSMWPRHTASSNGVRPLGSRRSTSCCVAKNTGAASAQCSAALSHACTSNICRKLPNKINISLLPPSSVALGRAPDTDCSTRENAGEMPPEPWLLST